ncbi:Flagellar motor rotation protein MotB [hydrothermal vent metagenome]|uniref:Flagellar motor rotation protein MotB n=1 Tax=hydrothermal vent metagenome TaxID=652676 RepID=A0A3B1BIU3_9ZZZZ
MAIAVAQKKKKKKEIEDFDSEFWMVTFGDLLSLMLTFFVLMFSMSAIDDKTLKDMFTAFVGGAGPLMLTESMPMDRPSQQRLVHVRPIELKKFLEFLQSQQADRKDKSFVPEYKSVLNALLISGVTIKKRGPSLVFSLPGESLFAPGSAKMSPKLKPALRRLSSVMRFSDTMFVIEGHTDNVPISTRRFPSNWELSATRAASVMQFFIDETPITAERLRAIGYGDTKPLVRNLSDNYRARNRRIDIILVQAAEK